MEFGAHGRFIVDFDFFFDFSGDIYITFFVPHLRIWSWDLLQLAKEHAQKARAHRRVNSMTGKIHSDYLPCSLSKTSSTKHLLCMIHA